MDETPVPRSGTSATCLRTAPNDLRFAQFRLVDVGRRSGLPLEGRIVGRDSCGWWRTPYPFAKIGTSGSLWPSERVDLGDPFHAVEWYLTYCTTTYTVHVLY